MRWLPAVSALLLVGCPPDPDPPACVSLDLECAPLYEPTFENVYDRTLARSCAVPGGACHAAEGVQGDLDLRSIDAAYDHLVNEGRVEPRDAECSLVAQRLYAEDPALVMPPGAPLDDPERCAVVQWIEAGAAR